MLYLDQLTPNSEPQVRDWTGHRIPMHAVPSGQVVLAGRQRAGRAHHQRPVAVFTLTTIVDAAASQARGCGAARRLRMGSGGVRQRSQLRRRRNCTTGGTVLAAARVRACQSLPRRPQPAELGELVKAAADNIRID